MAGYPIEDDPLAAAIGELLVARGEKLAVSETTAGGLVSARLLSVPGASRWYDGGIIPYAGAHRWTQLGLDVELARQHGAVSAPWVAATAEALRRALGCAWAVAESGIAGPQGSRRSPKPVGTVVIAVAGPVGTTVHEYLFPGSRVAVMIQIAEQALRDLQSALQAAPVS